MRRPALSTCAAILPRLEAGENVVCERYLDSSLAYQGFGRGLGVEAVRAMNAYAVGTVVPDRTFYLRQARTRENGGPGNSGCLQTGSRR